MRSGLIKECQYETIWLSTLRSHDQGEYQQVEYSLTYKWTRSKKGSNQSIEIQVKNRFPVKSASASEIKSQLLYTYVRHFNCK